MTLDCNEVHWARTLVTRIVNAKKKLLLCYGLFFLQVYLQVLQPGGDQNNQQKASWGSTNQLDLGRHSAST